MKKTIALSMLLLGLNAYACPNMSGEWVCSDSEGQKWTEKVVVTGNKYEFTYLYDGESKEQKDVIVADGRKVTEGPTVGQYVASFFNTVAEKSAKMLPEKYQAALVAGFMAMGKKANDLLKTETVYTCEGNSLKAKATFSGTFSLPMLISVEALGSGEAVEIMNGGKRTGTLKLNGTAVGKASLPFSKLDPVTEKLDQTITSNCAKK